MMKIKAMFLATLMVLATQQISAQSADEEEVVVIEDLTKAELREQIILVEDDLFRIFNANIDSDQFKFSCSDVTAVGTHMSERVCEPKFLTSARQRNNSDVINGIDERLNGGALQGTVSKEFEQLNEIYANLIEENEVFSEVVQILNALRARLAQLEK
jgi:hypothetical protein